MPETPEGQRALSVAAALTAETHALRVAVERRTYWIVAFGLVMLCALIALGLGVAQSYATQRRLADCTTPTGQCYREQQARTGVVVGKLNKTQLYIVECSRQIPDASGPKFDQAFEACVTARLAD